jgi:hypothetical protein
MRERQLKAAQLTALTQREESFRVRLLTALQEYSQRVRIDPPPDSCKLVDLLHYNSDILRSRTGSMLDHSHSHSHSYSRPSSSSSVGGAAAGGGGLVGTPVVTSRGRAQSPATAATAAAVSRSLPMPASGAALGGTGTRSTARKSSGSPEGEQLVGASKSGRKGDGGDLRSRLSPATQRFISQANDYAAPPVARRLPSPVLGRSDASQREFYNNGRSPSADASLRRSHNGTTYSSSSHKPNRVVDFLSSPSPAAGGSGSNHINSAGAGAGVGAGASSANGLSSSRATTNALQERLREAQKAFNAMQQSHSRP